MLCLPMWWAKRAAAATGAAVKVAGARAASISDPLCSSPAAIAFCRAAMAARAATQVVTVAAVVSAETSEEMVAAVVAAAVVVAAAAVVAAPAG